MRTARLVGLSPDGKSLIVATEDGEELAIAADDRLRAALRGDRPRLGQLEIEMNSSLRPRGEASGHRSLRITVTERLISRGIDIDSVTWDSYRLDDGRWAVTADYRSGEASRHAAFTFDPRARFSVAGNDEARWLLGEHPPAEGAQSIRRHAT